MFMEKRNWIDFHDPVHQVEYHETAQIDSHGAVHQVDSHESVHTDKAVQSRLPCGGLIFFCEVLSYTVSSNPHAVLVQLTLRDLCVPEVSMIDSVAVVIFCGG
jgi:hypothetical protein